MFNFGESFKKNLIIGAFGLLGLSGIGVVINGSLDVKSGTPIKSVVKDIAIDEAKSMALDYVNGKNSDSGFSLSNLFSKEKYKGVSDKKSGLIGYWKGGWDSEVYRIDKTIYIGNRKYNKPNGVNFGWSAINATDFEIGNYKNGVAKKSSYIAYDSDTAMLTIGEVKKSKFTDYCLVYDEYYNTFKFEYFKKGKNKDGIQICLNDNGTIEYIKKDKVYAEYDFDDDKFTKNITGNVDISKEGNIYIFNFDNRTYEIDTESGNISYISDTCEFDGTAYRFNCKYLYNDSDWINFDYTVLTNVGITCSDGTVGDVKLASDDPVAKVSVEMLVKLGLHALADTVIEAAETSQPILKVADITLELATGKGFSDMAEEAIDDVIDSYTEESDNENNSIIDNFKNKQEEKKKGKEQKEREEKRERTKNMIVFN